jgi:protein-tyrosine-phosphatase
MIIRNTCRVMRVLLLLSLSIPGSSEVLLHWSSATVPPANALGIRDLVISWNDSSGAMVKEARKQGYSVYVETQLQDAAGVAEKVRNVGAEGIILNAASAQRAELESALPRLKSASPKLRFMILNPEGKRPQMRGSMVIRRDSVLEVSSPTSQPWIDTNLSLVKIERRAQEQQTPLYTFSWLGSDARQQERSPSATDYSLAIGEAGAFRADLVLEVDERLQKSLNAKDPSAWRLWREVLDHADFYSRDHADVSLQAAANVAVIVDDLGAGDEAMNLMARHNLPFRVLRASDLQAKGLEQADVIVVFAKPDPESCQRLNDLARRGQTVVMVEAHGSYPWHSTPAGQLNPHATSYAVGKGSVIELSEGVTDPETFSQDIRRLLGTERALISLWNGLTTIAVPYTENGRDIKEIEFVNYAADPLPVQVQVKGSFGSVQYESPERACCETLRPVQHNGFTEFVIPELKIVGRVHLATDRARPSQ